MVTNLHLVIILGSPASGKTTLAQRLGRDLHIPILGKDDVKEALFDALGCGDREWSRRLSDASFAALMRFAQSQTAAGLSCIVEGNWRAAHALGLLDLMNSQRVGSVQIECRAAPAELARRFAARTRHPGHLDGVLSGELGLGKPAAAAFLDLPGVRLVYGSGAADGYPELLRALNSHRM
jgi:predicted kinase